MSQTRIQEGLINSSTVVPSNAGIRLSADSKQRDSASSLRFSRNDELIRCSSVAIWLDRSKISLFKIFLLIFFTALGGCPDKG